MASPNLIIPDIVQSQAGKEVTHNEAVAILDRAIAEHLAVSVAGGTDVTLTATGTITAQANAAVLELTGLLTANINVIVPNRDKIYTIHNNTTGAFTLTVKTAAGTGVVVEQGFKAIVYCNGTNVLELTQALGSGPYRTITGTVTIRSTDRILFCDATGGNITATLPAANTMQGRELLFIRVDSSANTVTIQRAGADDINNAATSKTITNTIGTALRVVGYSTSRFLAQTLTAA